MPRKRPSRGARKPRRQRGYPNAPLTDQQAKFCREFVACGNGAASARRAGYSVDRARIEASELLNLPHIQTEISRLIELRKTRFPVEQDQVIAGIESLALADARDVMAWGPEGVVVHDSTTLDPEVAGLIEAVKHRIREHTNSQGDTTRTIEVEVKVHAKPKLQELLLRARGWLRGGGVGDPFGGPDVPMNPVPVMLPGLREP